MANVPFEARWGFNFDCEWFGETESFTFLCFRFEREPHIGCVAWQIGVLGFLWTGTYLYSTKYVEALAAAVQKALDKEKNNKKEDDVNAGDSNPVVEHRVPDSKTDVLPPPE